MNHILIATDGSEGARAAALEGLAMARRTHAHVTLVYVRPWPPAVRARLVNVQLDAARAAIDEAIEIGKRWGVDVETELRKGEAAEEIVGAASEREADLIVVGARGLGPVAETLLGSVSRSVLRKTDVPVLVAKSIRERAHTNRLLVATDGSDGGQAAVEEAIELGRELGAALTFVYVRPAVLPVLGDPYYQKGLTEEFARARAALDSATAAAATEGIEADSELLEGDPAEEIAGLAKWRNVDLIIIGSRGLGRIAGALLGSTSHGVVRRADRPVLVARKRVAGKLVMTRVTSRPERNEHERAEPGGLDPHVTLDYVLAGRVTPEFGSTSRFAVFRARNRARRLAESTIFLMKNYVYVISCPLGLVKLGVATNPK